jgi:hypothetical protein
MHVAFFLQWDQTIYSFSNSFEISNFRENFGKKLEKLPIRTIPPNEHVCSVEIYWTLSELYFLSGVCRYDHGAGYNDDKIKKMKCAVGPSADPIVWWICLS